MKSNYFERQWFSYFLISVALATTLSFAIFLASRYVSSNQSLILERQGDFVAKSIRNNFENIHARLLSVAYQLGRQHSSFNEFSNTLFSQFSSVLLVEFRNEDGSLKQSAQRFMSKNKENNFHIRQSLPIWVEESFFQSVTSKIPIYSPVHPANFYEVSEHVQVIELFVPLVDSKGVLVILLDPHIWLDVSDANLNRENPNSFYLQMKLSNGVIIDQPGTQKNYTGDIYEYDLPIEFSGIKAHLLIKWPEKGVTQYKKVFYPLYLFLILIIFITILAIRSWLVSEGRLKMVGQKEIALLNDAKLANLGEVSSVLAHEINQPLSTIEVYSSLIESNLVGPHSNLEKVASWVSNIRKEVFRISNVIGNIREFVGRGVSLHDEEVSVQSVIESIRLILELHAKNYHCELKVNCFENFSLKINMALLQQVFFNLAKNSYEAMQEKNSSKKILEIEIWLDRGDGFISFNDTGVGMTQNQAAQVGTPLFTTKSYGTGLGISFCKTIVERYRGTIYWSSSENLGTTFTIRFDSVKKISN